MIEFLERTLAPFTSSEKPQVSPRTAASFIKNSPYISELCLIQNGFLH
jgi:hypothetical protein